MQVQNNISKQITGFTIVILLVGLSGCDWFSKNKKESFSGTTPIADNVGSAGSVSGQDANAIVFMNGKPFITEAFLQEEIDVLIESNPQFKNVMKSIDMNRFKRDFVDGLVNQAIVDHYIVDKKIDQSEAYTKEMERMTRLVMRSVKNMLNTKFFSQNLVVHVSDADARKFYEQNKECMPNMIIAQGGVKASGVRFDSEVKAKEFAAKVGEYQGDFQKAAAAAQLADKVQDFKLVNDQSVGLNPKLKLAIGELTQFPTVEIIKVDDKAFWVVQALEKQEPKYQPYEQIKANLIKMLEAKEHEKLIEEEVKKLRDEYNVKINESYFGGSQEPASEELDMVPVEVEDIDQESVYKE